MKEKKRRIMGCVIWYREEEKKRRGKFRIMGGGKSVREVDRVRQAERRSIFLEISKLVC